MAHLQLIVDETSGLHLKFLHFTFFLQFFSNILFELYLEMYSD